MIATIIRIRLQSQRCRARCNARMMSILPILAAEHLYFAPLGDDFLGTEQIRGKFGYGAQPKFGLYFQIVCGFLASLLRKRTQIRFKSNKQSCIYYLL
jgi:hypothetical protein